MVAIPFLACGTSEEVEGSKQNTVLVVALLKLRRMTFGHLRGNSDPPSSLSGYGAAHLNSEGCELVGEYFKELLNSTT